MGQLAFLKMFILVSIPVDIRDNRRHVHVFHQWCAVGSADNGRRQHSVAKIWIEKNGKPCVEIAESKLSPKENKMLVDAITAHWDFINDQITRCFYPEGGTEHRSIKNDEVKNGERTVSKNIERF